MSIPGFHPPMAPYHPDGGPYLARPASLVEGGVAAAAYEPTFWYMAKVLAKVGEVIYAQGAPSEWGSMTPAEAGRNAAEMMLYYAILRAAGRREEQRAIALYNAYGFGYALRTSFRNGPTARARCSGLRIFESSSHAAKTKHGCRLTLIRK